MCNYNKAKGIETSIVLLDIVICVYIYDRHAYIKPIIQSGPISYAYAGML